LLDNKLIQKLGSFIRSQVEIWTKHNPDIDEYDLAGACAIASYTLYRCLIKLGYQPKLIMADSGCGCHCWVELNNYIIDLTATQFNKALPKVLIVSKYSYKKLIPELKNYKTLSNNKNAVKFIKTWDQQSPLIYLSKIRRLVKNLNEKT
jgi:hypothetical protein